VQQRGRLLAFGNGGSATDAQDAAVDCLAPPVAGWQSIPAIALINDIGVVSAVGNDVGFDHVFSRQVIALGRAADIALGFSTSGASRNVLAAMNEAKARGLLTIAMSGGDGGALARSPAVDICVVAPTEYIPRIQEAHATAWHALLTVAQEALA
jgi:D-sedoheptulose 7-phosphate isomerase